MHTRTQRERQIVTGRHVRILEDMHRQRQRHICTHPYTCRWSQKIHSQIFTHMHACTHRHTDTHRHTHKNKQTNTYTHTHTQTNKQTNTHTHTQSHTLTYTHIYIWVHTQTEAKSSSQRDGRGMKPNLRSAQSGSSTLFSLFNFLALSLGGGKLPLDRWGDLR